MEEVKNNLETIFLNIKKSSGRPYKFETVKAKIKEIENLREKFSNLEASQEIEDSKALKLEFEGIYNNTKKLLEDQLQEHKLAFEKEKEKEINNKMADFDLGIAMKAIPMFSGNFKELDSFLKIVEIIHKGLKTTCTQQLIEFVFHVKLGINVKTALGNTDPNDFETLKSLLEERYKSSTTIPQIQNSLSNFSQRNLSVTSFRDKLLNTIAELNNLQIKELGSNATKEEKNVIRKMNDIYSLNIFKNGLNDNFKQTIFASQPKSLTEASNLAIELEKTNTNALMYYRHNPQNINRQNRQNFNQDGNDRNRFQRNMNQNQYNSNIQTRNSNQNNNFNRHNNWNNNRTQNAQRNNNQGHKQNQFRNTRQQIRLLHNERQEGNEYGLEYTNIPDSQN